MVDQITLSRINLLHPNIRAEVKDLYLNKVINALTGNAMCRLAYTLRTFEEQAELYSRGRTKLFDNNGNRLGIVTNATAGYSYHNYGLAFDIVLLVDKDKNGTYESASWDIKADYDNDLIPDWIEIVNIFKNAGYTWGGDWIAFKDYPHFQKTLGININSCLRKYNNKDFISNTKYIKI